MNKGKMLTPMEGLPAWMSRFGFPESWQQFLDAETMKVEEYREAGTLVVRAELPGMDPDKDVEVTVTDGMLRIHAERTQEHRDDSKEHYRSEFRYGAFTRVLPLPAGATETDVTASYHDGILEVRVPIGEEPSGARKVTIERS